MRHHWTMFVDGQGGGILGNGISFRGIYLQKLLTQSDQTWRQATSERKQAHILGNCHHDAMRTRQSAVIGAVCAQKSLHLGVSKAMLNDDSQESRSATCLSSTDDAQPKGLFSSSLAFIWAVDYLLSSPIVRTVDSTRCGVPHWQ